MGKNGYFLNLEIISITLFDLFLICVNLRNLWTNKENLTPDHDDPIKKTGLGSA